MRRPVARIVALGVPRRYAARPLQLPGQRLPCRRDRRFAVQHTVVIGDVVRVEPPAHYFGVPCRGAHDEAQLAEALDWALGLDGPSVVEAFVDPAAYSLTVYD